MRPLFVFLAGLAWALLTLAGNTWCERYGDVSIIGYYINFLPLGAVGVGLLAGCGFGLASYLVGFRITRKQFFAFGGAIFAAYWLERYVNYRLLDPIYKDTQQCIPFWTYTDYVIRSWAFLKDNGSPGDAWGVWGYSLLLFEIAAFCLGGVIVPAVVSARPYCWHCDHYMKLKDLGTLPASIPTREVVVTDPVAVTAYETEYSVAHEKGFKAVEALRGMAQAGQSIDYRSAYAPLLIKDIAKLPLWISLGLQRCPSCHNGRATAAAMSRKGDKVESQSLFQVDVPAAFVEKLESAL